MPVPKKTKLTEAQLAEAEARDREKETRKRILAAGREQKIKEEAEKAQLPVGILQAVGGLPPEDGGQSPLAGREEEEVEIPTVYESSTPSPPATPNTSPETSPEPTSFCVAVPAAMLMVSGMVFLSG